MAQETHTIALRVSSAELAALNRFKDAREFTTMSETLRELLPLQQLMAVRSDD